MNSLFLYVDCQLNCPLTVEDRFVQTEMKCCQQAKVIIWKRITYFYSVCAQYGSAIQIEWGKK